MYSVRIITILFNKLWGTGRSGKCTNIVSRGDKNGIWKRIRGIPGSFVWAVTIINRNVREIQICATKINRKGIIELVINCPIIVLSY